ncbi:MAG: hypothetical protein ACR2NL_12920 [Acidimicrobiia bacterium]
MAEEGNGAIKTGGKAVLRLVAFKSPDINASLFSEQNGGSCLEAGFAENVHESHQGKIRIDVTSQPALRSDQLMDALVGGDIDLGEASSEEAADLVVFSVQPDSVDMENDPDTFRENLRTAIRHVKEHSGAHIIVLNASNIDPEELTFNYSRVDVTLPERIRRLNLALVNLSIDEGISIIDVDRIVAQLGAANHVNGVVDYSCEASQVIGDEFLRIVEDIGFFEERPLLMQRGRGAQV